MRATDGAIRYVRIAGENASWITRAVFVACGMFAAIGLFLLERRIVGALPEPLSMVQLLTTATLVAAAAFVYCERTEYSNLSLSLAAGLTLVFAVACSWPGNRIIDWLVWPAALIPAFVTSIVQRSRAVLPPNPTSIRVADVADLEAEAESEKVLQNLTRVRTAEGYEAIRGSLVAEFQQGERQTTLHIAFCPPFERVPEVEVNIADDSDADVKLTQVLHHGTQVEIRLPEAAEESLGVELEFFAIDAGSE